MTNENQCSCYAIITDPIRKARLSGIFPEDHIPIKSPLVSDKAATGEEVYDFYELDKGRVNPEQRRLVANRLAPAFDVLEDQILQAFEDPRIKIPLRADSVVVVWCEKHARVAL